MIFYIRELVIKRLDDIELEIKALEKEYRELAKELTSKDIERMSKPSKSVLEVSRVCSLCGIEQPIEEFKKGFVCRECKNLQSNQRYMKNSRQGITKTNKELDKHALNYREYQMNETKRKIGMTL